MVEWEKGEKKEKEEKNNKRKNIFSFFSEMTLCFKNWEYGTMCEYLCDTFLFPKNPKGAKKKKKKKKKRAPERERENKKESQNILSFLPPPPPNYQIKNTPNFGPDRLINKVWINSGCGRGDIHLFGFNF